MGPEPFTNPSQAVLTRLWNHPMSIRSHIEQLIASLANDVCEFENQFR